MKSLLTSQQRAFLATTIAALLATQVPSCKETSNEDDTGHYLVGGTGTLSAGGAAITGGSLASGGVTQQDTTSAQGGQAAGGGIGTGGASAEYPATGGAPETSGGAAAGDSGNKYVVSLIQSSQANASDITQDEVTAMVSDAVAQAGGLDFIHDGMTVVLKPNLLTHLTQCWYGTQTLSPTTNGVTTDWRVTKAVADLVRAKNPGGQILVMEGSNRNTTAAFIALGYTSDNFGSSVNAFIPLEGAGCSNRSQSGLVQKAGPSGKAYWLNEQYSNADVIISIGALKTHSYAGITGAVKNLGIGATPNAMYSISTNDADCTRNMSDATLSNYIEHKDPTALGDFVADFFGVRPPDFALLDGLQGLQNGPCSVSAADRMNMRLILASSNAVALDTIAAQVMGCDPKLVPSLVKAESYGLGTTDTTGIIVVGKQVAEVKKSFISGLSGVCN